MSKQSAKLDFQDLPFLKLVVGFLLLVLTSTIVASGSLIGPSPRVEKEPEIFEVSGGTRVGLLKYQCTQNYGCSDNCDLCFRRSDTIALNQFTDPATYDLVGGGRYRYPLEGEPGCVSSGLLGYVYQEAGEGLVPLKIFQNMTINRNNSRMFTDAARVNSAYDIGKGTVAYIHEPNNVAKGKTISVSSGTGADNLVDGNHEAGSAQWVSDHGFTHWIEIDLEEEKEINEIYLYMGNGSDYSSTLSSFSMSRCTQQDVDDDLCDPEDHATGWRTIVSRTNNTEGVIRFRFDPMMARKIYFYSNTAGAQPRFYEIEAFEVPSEGLIPLYSSQKYEVLPRVHYRYGRDGQGECCQYDYYVTYKPFMGKISTSATEAASGGYSDVVLLGYLETQDYTPPGEPVLDAPANLSATDGDYADKVEITWDAVTDADDYKVYRADSVDGTKAEIVSQAGTTYEDDTVTQGTTYYYWTKACDADGCSDFSASDSGYSQEGVECESDSDCPILTTPGWSECNYVECVDDSCLYNKKSDGVQCDTLEGETGQCQVGQCVVEGETGEVNITVKFAGVTSRPTNDADQTVKVWGESLDGSVVLATKASPLSVTFSVDDQGLYAGTLNLTSAQLDKHYRLVIKGPRHLGEEFADVVLDSSGLVLTGADQELLPGDLNQDGLVNSVDVGIVNENTGPNVNPNGDLNYDNYTKATDKTLILQTLSVRQDPR